MEAAWPPVAKGPIVDTAEIVSRDQSFEQARGSRVGALPASANPRLAPVSDGDGVLVAAVRGGAMTAPEAGLKLPKALGATPTTCSDEPGLHSTPPARSHPPWKPIAPSALVPGCSPFNG